ncbi:MAG TPA: uroporphyrinogen-III C-methyltransferase, partial [Terriglobales bacterium]|nr:uroporphyrinogen-III C-methyltransferase [Terriglobales bacterium]
PEQLLDLAPPSAERIYVGKKRADHAYTQSEICALMIERARRGLTVVRLKGGDPFIFGRGGEEAEAARQAGIEYEIVPGVSAAIAVPAYAGIPLTHRDLASNVIFTTGYEQPGKAEPAVRWHELARSGSTLVLLMTARQLAANMEQLIRGGLDPQTPAAAIEWGTRADQRVVTGTVATLATLARDHDIKPPAIAVVGDVVRLRPRIAWFERRPLFGRRIVLTRPQDQSAELAAALEDLGAEVIVAPAIRIARSPDMGKLDEALRSAERFDWVVLTSANGVRVFFERLAEIDADVRSFHRARFAAIGPQTARALRQWGVHVDVVPADYRAEGLVAELEGGNVAGQRVLLPRAGGARDLLPKQLRALGAVVEEIETYRALPANDRIAEVIALARAGKLDLVTFTSSSTVDSFAAAVAGELDLHGLRCACIGPITAETARQHGLNVLIQPQKYTASDLAAAIHQHFGCQPRQEEG